MPTKKTGRKKQQEETEGDRWKRSDAKELLKRDLRHGTIPIDANDMDPEEVFLQRVEFVEFRFEYFKDRLKHERGEAEKLHHRAVSDELALAHDRRLFPKKATNSLGQPRWEGSSAERILKKDIDDGKHKRQKPKELYKSRGACQKFTLEVFRKHIHQEVKHRKHIAWCKDREEKKKQKRSKKSSK